MRLQELFPLMFYINLNSRPDRRKTAEKEFRKLNINPTRFSARKPNYYEDPKANAIVGCSLSHIGCLLEGLYRRENVLIFEDDVKFVNDYNTIIPNACDELMGMPLGDTWDMFYLGGNILKPFRQTHSHLARLKHCQSTHAYGVRAGFIPTLLSYIQHNILAYPLDVIYADGVIPKHNCYITAPKMVAVQRDSYSDIEMTTANYESYLERRYQDNFVPFVTPEE